MTRPTTRNRVNLNDAVEDLAPVPPPCFLNRISWREYLKSAAAVQNHKGEQTVIFITDAGPAFNMGLDFCEDCNSQTAAKMKARGQCAPEHLRNLETT